MSETDKNVEIQAQANWRNLRWPLRGGEPMVAISRGNATVSGTTDRYTAQVEADQDKRAELYKQIQAQVLADAVHVVLGYPARAIATQATVQNLQLSPLGSMVLREVDLS